MKGLIFNIKRYAIHDGPGIRVTFFLKGCPLNCWWCHNPEGISTSMEKVKRVDRIGSNEFEVIETVGKQYSVDDLVEVAEKDRIFIEESNGGVTFSGGEPLLQSDFLEAALRNFKKRGFHTAVDTSGQADRKVVEKIAGDTDLFLFDIKHLDPDKHKSHTGASNRKILSNYDYILNRGKDVIIRFPVIPGYNDDIKHLNQLRDYITGKERRNIKRLDLLPYHKIGSSKYKRFNLENRMEGVEQPGIPRMNELKSFFSETGFKIKIGG
ncbi:MAG TPA: glycyl-radical enzyme activating protein [Bacteroidales bacterium]|nr:glycyl-radical enzyme activating protein [Bacteroidales bacterium]